MKRAALRCMTSFGIVRAGFKRPLQPVAVEKRGKTKSSKYCRFSPSHILAFLLTLSENISLLFASVTKSSLSEENSAENFAGNVYFIYFFSSLIRGGVGTEYSEFFSSLQ